MANDGREARTARSGYTHSMGGCLWAAIGEHGISQPELKVWLDRLAPAVEALKEDYRSRRLPLLRIAEETADLAAAEAALAKLSEGATPLVRPRQPPLHRHLQVGRPPRDAGAGAGRDRRGQGGGPRGAHPQAL